MQIVKYMFQPHGDERGMLVALEEFTDIPFRIKRVYYMYDTVAGVVRGHHAHKELEQILICIHGSCKIRLDNGREKKIVPLEKPYEGLYILNCPLCQGHFERRDLFHLLLFLSWRQWIIPCFQELIIFVWRQLL